MPRRARRLLVVSLLSIALAAGCSVTGEDAEGIDVQVADDGSASGGGSTSERQGEAFDPTAERGDVDCTPEGLGEDESVDLAVAHQVVDGELGAICFGSDDEVLLGAWNDLVAISPPDQLNDLAAFAGFASTEDGDEQTLAYVSPLDGEGETFLMAINLDAYDADPDQALLTLAHEFSHIFTLVPSQIDRSDEAFESCDTYLSTEGCFFDDSLIAAWIETFWSDEQLASLDPEVEPSAAAGEERCAADPGFLGPYAASDPEEDFAESFSAYVFDVAVETEGQQARLDWLADQPGLVEFRERAVDAGLTPIDNLFEPCG